MLAAFVRDVETLRVRERDTLGDLLDGDQGAHWADFAARLGSSPAWPEVVNELLPRAVEAGRFELDGAAQLLP